MKLIGGRWYDGGVRGRADGRGDAAGVSAARRRPRRGCGPAAGIEQRRTDWKRPGSGCEPRRRTECCGAPGRFRLISATRPKTRAAAANSRAALPGDIEAAKPYSACDVPVFLACAVVTLLSARGGGFPRSCRAVGVFVLCCMCFCVYLCCLLCWQRPLIPAQRACEPACQGYLTAALV